MPSDRPAAFTRFDGHVRFTRREGLNVIGKVAMDLAFPRFLPPAWSDQDRAHALARIAPGVTHTQFQDQQHRRFSGGRDLVRGSYTSLCDANGDDFGTLESELRAYRMPSHDLMVDCLPAGRAFASQMSGSPLYIDAVAKSFVVCIYPAHALRLILEPSGVLSTLSNPEMIKCLGLEDMACILISPVVATATLDRVIDLRLPQTRNWFYSTFQIGDPMAGHAALDQRPRFSKPMGNACKSFVEMIPELIDPAIGGATDGPGGTTQFIGAWCRAKGAQALVYPSARNDAVVVYEEGEMIGFRGWNMVEYTKSLGPTFRNGISLSEWQQTVLSGIAIEAIDEGVSAGSLRTINVATSNNAVYERAVTALNSQLPGLMRRAKSMVVLRGSVKLDQLAPTDMQI